MGTLRTPRKLQTKADFLIIGGGMAGMSALAEARRLGIYAICFEARPKPNITELPATDGYTSQFAP